MQKRNKARCKELCMVKITIDWPGRLNLTGTVICKYRRESIDWHYERPYLNVFVLTVLFECKQPV